MKKSLYSEDQKALEAMLKEARKGAGLTQAQLAEKLEKPQSFVAKYEIGERLLNILELITILKVLGVKPCDFIDKLDKAIASLERQ